MYTCKTIFLEVWPWHEYSDKALQAILVIHHHPSPPAPGPVLLESSSSSQQGNVLLIGIKLICIFCKSDSVTVENLVS